MLSFPFTRFLSHWIKSSKVLARHNLQMAIQRECYEFPYLLNPKLSNHVELIALYEASRECAWLR